MLGCAAALLSRPTAPPSENKRQKRLEHTIRASSTQQQYTLVITATCHEDEIVEESAIRITGIKIL